MFVIIGRKWYFIKVQTCILLVCFALLFTPVYAEHTCTCDSVGQGAFGYTSKICEALELINKAEDDLQQDKLDSVSFGLNQAEQLLKSNRCFDVYELKLLKIWGDYYYHKSDFQNQLNIAYKILDISIKQRNKTDEAFILLRIAEIFNRNKQSQKGIEYAQKSYSIIQEVDTTQDKSRLWNMLSARYRYFFQDTKQPQYWDSAFHFSKLGLNEAKKRKNTEEQIFANVQLNSLSQAKGNLDDALSFLNAAQEQCVTPQYNHRLITIFGDKAYLYMQQNRLVEAKINADSSLKYALQVNYLPILVNTYSLLYEIEKKSGHYKEALQAGETERKLSDSLFSEEKMGIINELEKKYSQAKNEQQIERLSKQKTIYLLSTLAALAFIIAFVVFIRQKSLRQKHNELITEQRLQRARINPHFFFNALASLQNAILTNDDKKFLATYLAKFSKIMRESLESSYNDFVTLDQELNFVERYLQLQQLRFKEMFDFSIQIHPDIDSSEMMIPSMLLQPILENSIEHGFKGISYPGLISISLRIEGPKLEIQIKDNGVGLQKGPKDSTHVSRASQILIDRIYLLNKKFKTPSSFTILNNQEKGVCVNINIPIILQNEVQ